MSERSLLIAAGAVLALLFAAMPAWRGLERARFESHPVAAAEFEAKVAAMVGRDKVGEEDGVAVVRPPPGDVYVTAERWRFSPILQLAPSQRYRIHVASRDVLHGVVVAGQEALLVPGHEAVLTLTTPAEGRFTMVCSEYCGLEHNKMRHWVTVVDKP